jgi:hypothetical protein
MLKHSKTYWSVDVYRDHKLHWKKDYPRMTADREKLKAAGFKTSYRFDTKQAGEDMAAKIKAKTGVKMSCNESVDVFF